MERPVCQVQQIIGMSSMLWKKGNAHAEVQIDKRLLPNPPDTLSNTFCSNRNTFPCCVGQGHYNLIPSPPGDQVHTTGSLFNDLSYCFEHLISNLMPPGVIN